MTALRTRLRPAGPTVTLALGAALLLLVAISVPLARLARQGMASGGGTVALVPGFAVVGLVLSWRRPGNRLGWLLLGAAFFLVLSGDASYYAVADYRLHHGGLPLGWLAMLAQPGWAPAIVCFGLAVLLFPDGRLPSRRWRWVLWVYLALGTLWIVGALEITVAAIAAHNIEVDTGGNLLPLASPTRAAGWWGVIENVFFPALGAIWLASVGAQLANWRRASGERRQQLKWLVGGAAIAGVGGALTIALSGSASPVWRGVGAAGAIALTALPLGMGVAILKYRLYDIDRIISRTLAYAIVTGLLAGVYTGLVLLATQVLRFHTPVAVGGATLAAAALLRPLLRRVQQLIDRRFNRARYDADLAIAAFASRLAGTADLDTVCAELLGTADRALEPARVSVWITPG